MRIKIVIPAEVEHELEIDPRDFDIEMWKANIEQWKGYPGKLPVCEGVINEVKNPHAKVPEVIAELLNSLGKVAFFTREDYPELCRKRE